MATQLTIISSQQSRDESALNSNPGRSSNQANKNGHSSGDSGSRKRPATETDWIAITPEGYQIVIPGQTVEGVLHFRAGQQVLAEIDSGEPTSVRIG